MNEIAKVFSSLLLLGAGFAGASLFGPPDLVDNFANQWSSPAQQDPQALRPLDANTPAMPQPLVASAGDAMPIESAVNDLGFQPAVGQFAANSTTNQTITTQWNDQPLAATSTPNDWLREIHAPTTSNASNHSEQSHHVAKANPALAALPELQGPQRTSASSQQPPIQNVDPTSADAWGIPDVSSADQPFVSSAMSSPVDVPSVQKPFGSLNTQEYQPAPYESAFRGIEAPAVQRAPERLTAGSERTHVVADGDTLPLLAERYLGDARLAQELYMHNQDRLQHPDLLPIGVILKLPNRPAQVAAEPSRSWQERPAPQLVPAQSQPNDSPFSSSPFTTIGNEHRSTTAASQGIVHQSKVHQSKLVPIGEEPARPVAATPESIYQEDYSW